MTIYNNLMHINTRRDGFADYNNTLEPQNLIENTEQVVLNNGLGSNTNTNFLPDRVTSLMDTQTGYLNFSELELGDTVIIRNDFLVTPLLELSTIFVIFELGFGDPNSFRIIKQLPKLVNDIGVAQRVITNELIYIGSDLVKNKPCRIIVSSTSNITLKNNGVAIIVNKRG